MDREILKEVTKYCKHLDHNTKIVITNKGVTVEEVTTTVPVEQEDGKYQVYYTYLGKHFTNMFKVDATSTQQAKERALKKVPKGATITTIWRVM